MQHESIWNLTNVRINIIIITSLYSFLRLNHEVFPLKSFHLTVSLDHWKMLESQAYVYLLFLEYPPIEPSFSEKKINEVEKLQKGLLSTKQCRTIILTM